MSVIGIEKLEFGVDNLAACQQFLQDFGQIGRAHV